MRELKFRAWDNVTERILNGVTPIPQKDGNNILVAPNGYNIISQRGDNANVETEFCFGDYEIMQYTGLKDENGKEIYEGDIVPCVYAFDGCVDHVMKVEWDDRRCGFFPRWDYGKCHQKGVTKTMYDLTSLEVIGNIYENPGLLTPQKP